MQDKDAADAISRFLANGGVIHHVPTGYAAPTSCCKPTEVRAPYIEVKKKRGRPKKVVPAMA